MGKRLGLLAGSVDYSNAAADEFHDWLDTEHIPERTRLAGILNAVRWLGVANPNGLPRHLRPGKPGRLEHSGISRGFIRAFFPVVKTHAE